MSSDATLDSGLMRKSSLCWISCSTCTQREGGAFIKSHCSFRDQYLVAFAVFTHPNFFIADLLHFLLLLG